MTDHLQSFWIQKTWRKHINIIKRIPDYVTYKMVNNKT